jgi:hypothetical protein
MCGPPPMINFACIPNLDKLGYKPETRFSYWDSQHWTYLPHRPKKTKQIWIYFFFYTFRGNIKDWSSE